MSDPLPQRSDGYAAPQGMKLNKASWDAALVDIDERLVSLEDQRADLQEVIDTGTSQALAVIAANIGPEIQSARDNVAELQALASDTISTLNEQLVDLQNSIDVLLEGGAPATAVVLAPITGVAATNAQAAFAEHQTDIDGLSISVATLNSTVTTLTANVTAARSAAAAVYAAMCIC